MARFRNGIPIYVQEIALSKEIPSAAKNLKVTLEIDGKTVGSQWLHFNDGPKVFANASAFRWDILARTLELIETMHVSEIGGVLPGVITDIRFEDADHKVHVAPPEAGEASEENV